MSLLQPTSPKYQDFADQVRKRALNDFNYTFYEGEEVNFFIGAFYDGVYLLGMALNETLTQIGKDGLRDGLAITKRMWNRDFKGDSNIFLKTKFSQKTIKRNHGSCTDR